ncbi:MAG TPA: POTRA domain-containing protein, partial [Polyangiaceae bacterium]|nr:POTRA domain-containing protein [Polyangiaceae bacterium]
MSGSHPASVAIRKRLRRARVLALLWGLAHRGVALAQLPITPPATEPPAAEVAPPPVASAPPELPVAGAPPSLPEPDEAIVDPGGLSSAPEPDSKHVPLRYTLEAIQVRGNTRTERRVVLRYVPFKPGNVFDVDDPEVELSRFRLLGTGFFRDVQYSLKKGSVRGLVVLVIDVRERNTIVINDVSMGLAADSSLDGQRVRRLSGYAGLDVAETNLAGTGITLGGAMAVASNQLALRVR